MRRLLAWTFVLLSTLTAISLMEPAPASATGIGLDIGTLPAFANYPVTLDGERQLTDAQGVAHFPKAPVRPQGLTLPMRLKLTTQNFAIGGVRNRVQPARIYSNGTHPVISLNVFYHVGFGFKNSNGGPLDASAIHNVTVKSSIGAVAKLPAHTKSWLQGSRVVPLAGGLEIKKLYWTVQDVEYAGTSVVNSSQQRFEPAKTQQYDVTLLFYSARVRVHDAVFGFRQSGTITIVYPDNSSRKFTLDSDGSVTIPSLPRGDYKVQIDGFGPKMTQELAISTNQDLDLKHYSWVDIAVGIVLGLFLSIGLVLIGLRRRHHIRRDERNATVGSHDVHDGPELVEV